MDLDDVHDRLSIQCRNAYFDLIEGDLRKDPPKTDTVKSIIRDIIESLKTFVPSRTDLHTQMTRDIPHEVVDASTMATIVTKLIHWIEQFQSPAHDHTTQQWLTTFQTTTDYPAFLSIFFKEYLEHTEEIYKEVWDARQRLATGENIVPAEHRPNVEGSNGVPTNMRSGR
jgi:hypothetical protein